MLLALPLGELAKPQALTERAYWANRCCPSSGAARHLPPVGEGFSGSDTVSCSSAKFPAVSKGAPLGELANAVSLREFVLLLYLSYLY